MASIVGYGSKHSHQFTLTCTETGTSQSGNYSTVSFSFTLYLGSWSWNHAGVSYIVTINGQQYTGSIPSYNAGNTLTITSGSLTVPHDSNGSKTLYFSFSVTDNSGVNYTCGNASASGSMALTNIYRQPATPTLSLYEVTDCYFRLNWSTNMVIDSLWTSYDRGVTWRFLYNPNSSSGRIWIGPAIPNTAYEVMIRVRGKDSQLTSDSSIFSIRTLDISRIASMEPVIHGEPIKLNVTSPANNNPITLQLVVNDTEIFTKSVTKGDNTLTMTDNELDSLYSLYGNGDTLTGTFNLAGTNYYGEKEIETTTKTITLKGNQKTANNKIGNNWKRGKVWINNNGTWTRGVIWTKVSGSWKRGV